MNEKIAPQVASFSGHSDQRLNNCYLRVRECKFLTKLVKESLVVFYYLEGLVIDRELQNLTFLQLLSLYLLNLLLFLSPFFNLLIL